MKKNIYLYLLVFSLLVNVFQYVNSKGIIDKYEKDIKKFKAKIEVLKNSKSEATFLEIDKNKTELLLTYKQSEAKEVSL
jgi:hypothetical protein|tara:strand:+ start:606 stop:842 length:237 start_codon:yes stop_codon:yes gene_type:complete